MISRYGQYLWHSAQAQMWSKTVECLERNDSAQFLDLGCYAGIKTLRFAEIIGTNKLFGVDIVDEMLAEAKKRGIITYKADLDEPLPLPSDSMDVVIANQVVEHLTNLDSFISEIFRILKRGGYLVLTTENLASWHNIFALLAGDQPYTGPELSSKFDVTPRVVSIERDEYDPRGVSPHHAKVGTFKALKKLFRAYGFQIDKMYGCGYHPFPGVLARGLSHINPSHSHFIVLKARKP